MELKFWGTHGSCAAPFADRSEYGGNTSCVTIHSGNRWVILDAGTGIIPLASEIRRAASEPDAAACRISILITHFHLDHIIGLPMFLAALPKNADVTIYTATDSHGFNAAMLNSLIGPPLWPVKLTDVCRGLRFEDLQHSADISLGDGITVIAMASNHPDHTSVFRIRWDGIDIVYGLDCEITDSFEESYVRFAAGCDYLLYDGAYTDEDYQRCVGFGHSAISRAARIAELTGAKKLFIQHYDYAYTDAFLREIEKATPNCDGRICFAREGQQIELIP